MSEQALDMHRSLQIVRRHKKIVGMVAVLGLLAGVGYALVRPPLLESIALVELPPTTHNISTQVVIASSDKVLLGALPHVRPAMSLQTLRSRIQAKSLTSNIISVGTQGKTAVQAESTANAVADSFVTYLSSKNSAAGQVRAWVLESATNATGTSLLVRLLVNGGLGALLGALIGAIGALALWRGDRRLRERDEIADAIGVPVLASVPVEHPTDAGGWVRLLEDYEPGIVHAWNLRKALHHLGLTDYRGGGGGSLAVLSLSADPKALALGPQMAAFAASLSIPTALVIGCQQDTNTTATLSAACEATSRAAAGRSSLLRVTVGDREPSRQPGAGLTVVVAVVDGSAPRLADLMSTSVTVLGVSAGAATAEQLARVAVAAAGEGREIAGIIVADPDSTDHTTGRLPQPAQTDAPAAPDAPDRHYTGDQTVNDRDQTAALSLSQGEDQQGEDLPGRLWDFGEVLTDEDRSAAELATGLTSLGFIRAALRRSARFWCTTAVIGLLAGFGVLRTLPPAYQASTSVYLANNPFEIVGEAALNDQAIAQSRTVAGAALRKLGLRQNVGSFVADYTVTIVTNQLLLITVKATSSELAVREANVLAATFLTFQAHQLQTQERLVNVALQQQVTLAQERISLISSQISKLSAQPATPAEKAQRTNLVNERGRDTSALTALKQANLANQANTRVNTTQVIQGSQVLDQALAGRYSTKKYLVIYAGTGLIVGLAIGMFIVVVRALVSDRLRRRDDVARALGVRVKLSVGKVRQSRWRPGPRGLTAAQSTHIRRIVAHLNSAVHMDSAVHLGGTGSATSNGIGALAVVPVDEPQVAALSLVSLAVSAAQQGLRVVVADLCGGSPAGRLLESTDPGVHPVRVDHAQLTVAIPDRDDVVPAGPLSRTSQAQRAAFTEAVDTACAEADLLLTLAAIEPSLGAEHLAGWAHGAVVVVTAGRSSAARVHAVGEMIRLAGMELISAVLVGADKADESIGVPDLPGTPTSVGPGPAS